MRTALTSGFRPLHNEFGAAPLARLTSELWLGQGEWKKVMESEPWKGKSYVKDGGSYPATFINWEDAVSFCERLGEKDHAKYRLPTEAEREYAAKAGTATAFSFGDNQDDLVVWQ